MLPLFFADGKQFIICLAHLSFSLFPYFPWRDIRVFGIVLFFIVRIHDGSGQPEFDTAVVA